jgi:HEAT repeat protein
MGIRILATLMAFGAFSAVGCAAPVGDATLRREVDPLLERGQARAAATAYRRAAEREGARDPRRLRLLAETTLWAALSGPEAQSLPREARLEAVRLAASVNNLAVARALPPLLVSPDAELRVRAAAVLAAETPEARPILTAALGSTDPTVRLAAVESDAVLPDAEHALRAATRDPAPAVRAAAIAALSRRGTGDDLAAALARDPEPSVRAAAIGALGQLGARRHRDLVRAALDDAQLGVRLAALGALVRLDGNAPERLLALASSTDRYLALRAAVQLTRLGQPRAARDAIARAAADVHPEVRVAAMNAAGELGPDGVQLAIPLCRDPDVAVRLAAARAALHARDERDARRTPEAPTACLTALAGALDGPRAIEAAEELSRRGDGRAHDLVGTLVTKTGGDVSARRAAVTVVSTWPDGERLLVAALADDEPLVRLPAAAALLRRLR